MGVGGKKKGATRRHDIHPLDFIIYFLRLIMVTKERLKETLREYGIHKYCSDWDNLVENLMSEFEKTYNEGYSFCKKESSLVEKAAESLSD